MIVVWLITIFAAGLLVWRYAWRDALNPQTRNPKLSWRPSLIGFVASFLLGAGFSASNMDIRTEVEIAGVAACLVFALLGFAFTYIAFREYRQTPSRRWIRSVIIGLVSNGVLASMTAVLTYESYLAKHPSHPALDGRDDQAAVATTSKTAGPIWIDTDPACGVATATDVDDCLALLTALRSPELRIVGASTVFGNQPGERLTEFVREILPKIQEDTKDGEGSLRVFEGSMRAGNGDRRSTPASEAMASALRKTKLRIIALGPLTNVATLLNVHPELTGKIGHIIMVAGKHPGQLFHPGHQWWFHFGDFNVSHDPDAAETVLDSGVPITLIPFEVATKLTITRADLETLRSGDAAAQWLSDVSRSWFSFWQQFLGKDGFHPFDALAVGYAALPEFFTCKQTRARIGFNLFLEPLGIGRDLEVAEDIQGRAVTYCYDLDNRLKDILLERIRRLETASFAHAGAQAGE